ncbi:unnamed protein product [Closterium sp. NIES-54]
MTIHHPAEVLFIEPQESEMMNGHPPPQIGVGNGGMRIHHHPPEVLFIEPPLPRSQVVGGSMGRAAERAQVLTGGGATGRAQVLSLEVPSPGPSPGPSCGMDWEGIEIGEEEREEGEEEGWIGEEGEGEGAGEWMGEGWAGWRERGMDGAEDEGEGEEEEEEEEEGEEEREEGEEDDAEFCSPTWREWHHSAFSREGEFVGHNLGFLEEGEMGEGMGVGGRGGAAGDGARGGDDAREGDGARQGGWQEGAVVGIDSDECNM